MDVANLLAGSPQPFPLGFLGAFPQATRGDEILPAGKAPNILDLLQNDQGQDLPNARDGVEASKRLPVVRFGTARQGACHLAE